MPIDRFKEYKQILRNKRKNEQPQNEQHEDEEHERRAIRVELTHLLNHFDYAIQELDNKTQALEAQTKGLAARLAFLDSEIRRIDKLFTSPAPLISKDDRDARIAQFTETREQLLKENPALQDAITLRNTVTVLQQARDAHLNPLRASLSLAPAPKIDINQMRASATANTASFLSTARTAVDTARRDIRGDQPKNWLSRIWYSIFKSSGRSEKLKLVETAVSSIGQFKLPERKVAQPTTQKKSPPRSNNTPRT